MKDSKFNKLYKLILEETRNPNLDAWPDKQYDYTFGRMPGDRVSTHDGACGSVVRVNKTYKKWLEQNQKAVYKKFDYDPQQTYQPVLADLNGVPTKSYTGAQLETIKQKYKNAKRYNLQLVLYYLNVNDPSVDDIRSDYYEFKNIVTIDEQNFYLNKSASAREGFSKRKAFYIVLSQLEGGSEPDQTCIYSMRDLEDSDWLIQNTATVQYYMQKDVQPYFDGASGEGRIFAEILIMPGEQNKLEQVKQQMLQMGLKIKQDRIDAKRQRAASSPAKIKRWNDTRLRHIKEAQRNIAMYEKMIEQEKQKIERLKSQLFDND